MQYICTEHKTIILAQLKNYFFAEQKYTYFCDIVCDNYKKGDIFKKYIHVENHFKILKSDLIR